MTARSNHPHDRPDSSPDPSDLPEVTDPAEAIASALARLRGRRPSSPPWARGGPRGHHGPHGHHDHGHHGSGDDEGEDDGDGDRMHGWPHRGRGAPPWGGGGGDASSSNAEHDNRNGVEGGGHRGSRAGPRFGGHARLRMLDALANAPEPLSVSEIGDAVGVDQPRASRLVQQSVKLGLVRREADQDDARRTRVALTDEGRTLVTSLRGERRAAIDAALEGFSPAERKELARLLTRLADAWPQA